MIAGSSPATPSNSARPRWRGARSHKACRPDRHRRERPTRLSSAAENARCGTGDRGAAPRAGTNSGVSCNAAPRSPRPSVMVRVHALLPFSIRVSRCPRRRERRCVVDRSRARGVVSASHRSNLLVDFSGAQELGETAPKIVCVEPLTNSEVGGFRPSGCSFQVGFDPNILPPTGIRPPG
jgi:hypothetical protein